ncbi:MAG: heme o synthase [Acidimicrobiales bacterium]
MKNPPVAVGSAVMVSHASAVRPAGPLLGRAGAYVALTKPRIIELLLVTTLPTMIVAQRGLPRLSLVAATLVGGTLAAGGANAVNMYVDRDIDRLMHRTENRPLVTGTVTPPAALAFACALEVAAFFELWSLVNLLSAALALAATAFYVGVYTLWLKRRSTQNIVVGGAAGAVPVLVGWAAVTGSLAWPPVVLFGVIFLWTPPHFWSLAVRYREDYAAAHVPMLPVVAPPRRISRNVFWYTAATVAVSIAFVPLAHMGITYTVVAAIAGAAYLAMAARLWVLTRRTSPIEAEAMRLFGYSITYLTLLFGAMALDVFVRRIH